MTEETQATEQTGPGLQMQDLVVLVNSIDVASQRGAFQGGELETVGRSRNAVAAFIQANAPAPAEEETTEEAPAE